MRPGLIIVFLCCLLAACGNGEADVPSGQVVATVDGQEITAAELNLELGDTADDPHAEAERRKATIRALIARKLLVAEAEARELNRTAEGMFTRARARDLALVDLLRRDVSGEQDSAPSESEVDRYVNAHADAFRRRELITAEQTVLRGTGPDLVSHLRTLPSLEAVNAYLNTRGIPATSTPVVLDTLYLQPETAAAIARAGPAELVAVAERDGSVRVLRVAERRSALLGGEQARLAARMLLIRDAGEATRARLEHIIRNGRASPALAAAGGS